MAQPAVQTFGKYQILERIATGGMAEIYKARLEGIGGFQRTFAIKRILPHLSQNADYVAMLVDEAKVAGLLSHANIVQILDLGQVDAVWYIAMEYVNGRDLGAVLERARMRGLRLPVPHTVFVAIELLKGLEYAHQRQVMRGGRPVPLNIIHRDVSPPNILLSFQGEVKLTDFGIARASLKVMETQAGVIKGRFDYMSPEQAMGAKDLDQRSDLFSVGVVLYETLTGRHPFRAESELQTLENVRAGRYVALSTLNPDLPFTLETIVDRALRVDREERYPTATAFKEALDKFFHDAGFIFTHATLAQYVRGLFPEIEGGSAANPTVVPVPEANEESDRPTEVITDEVDAVPSSEDPTHLMDRRVLDEEIARQAKDERSHFALKPSEESTEVKRNPLLAPRPADWADDQETVIRKAPTAETPEPDGPATTSQTDPSTMSEISTLLRRRPTPETPQRVASRPSGPPVGLLVAAVGAVLFAAGLFFGALLGAGGASLIMGGPAVGVTAPTTATLTVLVPDGMTVTIEGKPASGPVELPAGAPQRIHVEGLRGFEPWEQTLTFGPGEMRLLVITPAELTPIQP